MQNIFVHRSCSFPAEMCRHSCYEKGLHPSSIPSFCPASQVGTCLLFDWIGQDQIQIYCFLLILGQEIEMQSPTTFDCKC